MTLAISPLRPDETEAAVALWEACGLTRPWNDQRADIALALGRPSSTILAGRIDSKLVATAMTGSDGHRGWVYYLATDPDHLKRGVGRMLMAAAEGWLRQLGCPRIRLMVRGENLAARGFYRAIGYDDQDVVTLGRTL